VGVSDSVRFVMLAGLAWKTGSCVFHLNNDPRRGGNGAGARSGAVAGSVGGGCDFSLTCKFVCLDSDFVCRVSIVRVSDSVRFVAFVVVGWTTGSCVFHLNRDPRRAGVGAGASSGAGAGSGGGECDSCSTGKPDCLDFDSVFKFSLVRISDWERFVALILMARKACSCVSKWNKEPRGADAGARSDARAGCARSECDSCST